MTPMQLVKGVGIATTVGVLTGMLVGSATVRARDDGQENASDSDARVKQGFNIAPVPLNLARKNRALVGLGSYFVNGVSGCNGCHSAGPATEFTPTGNPYLLMPPFSGTETVNPATYLGGGRDFGPFPGPGSPVNIISRNLTPDKTGLPIGGDSFSEFLNTIRTGVDPDNLHPVLAPPFNGTVLQIMPWPVYQKMRDRDLRAIYEYPQRGALHRRTASAEPAASRLLLSPTLRA